MPADLVGGAQTLVVHCRWIIAKITAGRGECGFKDSLSMIRRLVCQNC